MKLKSYILLSLFILVTVLACSKDDSTRGTTFKVKLTDAPFNAQQVNVDIKEVRVNFANDTLPWTTLQTNARVYNLLTLQNGVDTLLATSTVPAGTVKQIRFILGTNNTIMIDSVVYPLSVAGGDEGGLKINLDKKLRAGIDSVLIDFDAALSVIKTGNGKYKLKPVLKLKK
ncbi:MAG TPA: DUF4382 domain-containing protein [Segetibacter sp.]|jgi:hypothetical protein